MTTTSCNGFEVLEKYMTGGLCGFDPSGCPVWYEIIKTLDFKGILLSSSKQDFLKKKFKDCEMLREVGHQQTQKLGRKIETLTMIYDFYGLGLKHLWTLWRSPRLFPVVYNLVKHLLSEETCKKILVLR